MQLSQIVMQMKDHPQSDCPHTTAVRIKCKSVCKCILRLFSGERHIIVQQKHLCFKRWIVSEYTDRIIVNMKSVRNGFNGYRFVFICNYPVKPGGRKFIAERSACEINFCKQVFASLTLAHLLKIYGINSNCATFSLLSSGSA